MEYAVILTRTTGRPIEEKFFSDFDAARQYFEQTASTTPFERVLIILAEKPDPYSENILDVEFKDGINYAVPRVGSVLQPHASNNPERNSGN